MSSDAKDGSHSSPAPRSDLGTCTPIIPQHVQPLLYPQDTVDRDRPSKEWLNIPIVPSRPSSPGTISLLSQDDLLHPEKHSPTSSPSTWHRLTTPSIRAFCVHNLGLFYMLLAQVFGTGMNVAVRILETDGNGGKGLHPLQILSVRMGITVILATSYMAYSKTPYFPFGMPEIRPLLVVRAFGGFFGVSGMYYSLKYLPVADSTVLTYLAPGLACWVCSLLIGEPFTRTDRVGTFVSLLGVVFIAKPTSLLSLFHPPGDSKHGQAVNNGTMAVMEQAHQASPAERLAAVGMAMVGVAGAVCAVVCLRCIGKRAHPLISTNAFAVACTVISFVWQIANPDIGFLLPANAKEWALLGWLGACGFVMQFCLAAGLQYEKSSRATNMTYTSMLFASASDKIFFNITPGMSSVVGSAMILGAAIVMALQKAQEPSDVVALETAQNDEEMGLMSESIEQDAPDEGMEMTTVR